MQIIHEKSHSDYIFNDNFWESCGKSETLTTFEPDDRCRKDFGFMISSAVHSLYH